MFATLGMSFSINAALQKILLTIYQYYIAILPAKGLFFFVATLHCIIEVVMLDILG